MIANPFDLIDKKLSNIEGLLLDLKHGEIKPVEQKRFDRYVYGIGGLASLLNCSNVTAQKLKNSGKIPFTQSGRKIIFDREAVLSALTH